MSDNNFDPPIDTNYYSKIGNSNTRILDLVLIIYIADWWHTSNLILPFKYVFSPKRLISMQKDEKYDVSRRGFLKTVGTAVVGLAVGAGVGYGVYPTINPSEAGKTVTVTTGEGPGGITSIPVEGKEPHERLMHAMKFVAERDGLKGKNLVLMHPGGGSASYDAVKDEFESETGVMFEHSEVPLNEIFDKAMLEAVSKAGEYDLFSIQPMMIADMAESGLITPLDDYVKWFDNRFHGMPDGYVYPLDHIMAEYEGKIYAAVQDGEYPLMAPKTWEEYIQMGEFFNRPDEDRYGITELRSAERGYIKWFGYYSCRKYPSMLPFDENMDALLNTDEGIKATELFLEALKYMPSETPSWDFQPVNYAFASGNVFLNYNFPSAANFFNTPDTSNIVGRYTVDVVPGAYVEGPGGKEILLRRTVQGAGWSIPVSNYSKMKDFAALYAMWLTSPEKAVIASSAKASWMDPCRYNQLGPNADPREQAARGARTLEVTLTSAQITVPVICGVRGGFEYNTTLSRNLHATQLGTMDAAECMERTAKEWDEITDRIGREEQVAAWIDYMKYYPTAIL
jgi:multiple sugar transport system substrate-binding protein